MDPRRSHPCLSIIRTRIASVCTECYVKSIELPPLVNGLENNDDPPGGASERNAESLENGEPPNPPENPNGLIAGPPPNTLGALPGGISVSCMIGPHPIVNRNWLHSPSNSRTAKYNMTNIFMVSGVGNAGQIRNNKLRIVVKLTRLFGIFSHVLSRLLQPRQDLLGPNSFYVPLHDRPPELLQADM